MKTLKLFCAVGLLMVVSAVSAFSQRDDIRQATGLPIPIGAPAIYGRVTLDGHDPKTNKPVITVTLMGGGTQVEKTQANDNGYWYFLRRAQDGATLIFEVNNMEVGREVLTTSVDNSIRKDISINWKAYQAAASQQNAVVSAVDLYGRKPANESLLKEALEARKQKKNSQAADLLRKIVANDPKDFVAWTELGSVLFSDEKFGEAEIAYGRALEQKPDFSGALMNLGKLYLSQKKFDLAITAFTRAATVDENSADAYHYLGEAYLQARQGSKAVVALNEAIRLAPVEKAEIHLRLATLYNAAGAKHLASVEYTKFLEKVPNHPEKKNLEKYISENPVN